MGGVVNIVAALEMRRASLSDESETNSPTTNILLASQFSYFNK